MYKTSSQFVQGIFHIRTPTYNFRNQTYFKFSNPRKWFKFHKKFGTKNMELVTQTE